MRVKLIYPSLIGTLLMLSAGCGLTPPAPPVQSLEVATATPIPTATAAPLTTDTWTDEFADRLSAGWHWTDEDPTHWNLTEAPGALRILTQGESLYLAGRPANLLLREAPAGDFEITTRVHFDPRANFQQAAILVYQDHDNFVLLNRGFCQVAGCPGSGVFLDSEQDGRTTPGPRAATTLTTTWLKLQKAGTRYTGYFSADGAAWVELGSVSHTLQASQVGLTANNSRPDPSVEQLPADFDFVSIATLESATVSGESVGASSANELSSEQRAAEIPAGQGPFRVAVGAGAVWVAAMFGATVTRIDPETNRVAATIPVGSGPVGIAAGADAVWVANGRDGTVMRIDPANNQVVARVEVGPRPRGFALGEDSVWVTHGETPGLVSRIDPSSNRVVRTLNVDPGPAQAALSEGALWVASKGSSNVLRIDPATNQIVARVDVGFPTVALVAGEAAVWVAGDRDARVARIDPGTNQVVAMLDVMAEPWGLVVHRDGVWVSSHATDTVWHIDAATNALAAGFKVDNGPLGLASDSGSLWVAHLEANTVWRINP